MSGLGNESIERRLGNKGYYGTVAKTYIRHFRTAVWMKGARAIEVRSLSPHSDIRNSAKDF